MSRIIFNTKFKPILFFGARAESKSLSFQTIHETGRPCFRGKDAWRPLGQDYSAKSPETAFTSAPLSMSPEQRQTPDGYSRLRRTRTHVLTTGQKSSTKTPSNAKRSNKTVWQTVGKGEGNGPRIVVRNFSFKSFSNGHRVSIALDSASDVKSDMVERLSGG